MVYNESNKINANMNISIGAVIENVKGGVNALAKVCAGQPQQYKTIITFPTAGEQIRQTVGDGIVGGVTTFGHDVMAIFSGGKSSNYRPPPKTFKIGENWADEHEKLKNTAYAPSSTKQLLEMFSSYVLPFDGEQGNIMMVIQHNCNKHGANRLWQVVCLPKMDWNWNSLGESEYLMHLIFQLSHSLF